MPTLLVSHRLHAERGDHLAAWARQHNLGLELLPLPADPEGRLGEADRARLDCAFFSPDVYPKFSRQFFSTLRNAPRLDWLHVYNVGVDHPIYAEMLQRGVRLTTSAGTTAEPIAQTAIAGLLMLARNFPHWLQAQQQRRWDPVRFGGQIPRDLSAQTLLVYGLGSIGAEIARLARALGLNVIGVRRSGPRPDDPVDELHPPQKLADLLPRADWLVIASPLTAETRGLIDAAMLHRLPAGARLINIGRGEIVDEAALVAALQSGQLGGAYLDVFTTEPLPENSPLWTLPNVLVSPHNSAAASGNDDRVYQLFLDNLRRWHLKQALTNEVRSITPP
ncbi:MAG: D-2-hydroxyacid dehydrogenase [Betaproteobacteria bacterium]|jgi:phosphoglycerate dehydrogenase-like enzyme|nr:D-2-hydroxyacid dehydrogenase [Betaproteobacteria bacterium]